MTKGPKIPKVKDAPQLTLTNLEAEPLTYGAVILNRDRFIQTLSEIDTFKDINYLKNKIIKLKNIISYPKNDQDGIINIDGNGDTISLRKDVVISELKQICEAKTLERANYYLKRLENSVKKIKTNKINDINLLRWKEYDEITTDSLLILSKRDTSGTHLGIVCKKF